MFVGRRLPLYNLRYSSIGKPEAYVMSGIQLDELRVCAPGIKEMCSKRVKEIKHHQFTIL
jgi:hypothetical protein